MRNQAPPGSLEADIIALLPALRAFSTKLTRSRSDADDLIQETIAHALGHLDRYEENGKLRSWLFTIMRNVFISGFNKAKREISMPLEDSIFSQGAPAQQEWATDLRHLYEAADELPSHLRHVFIKVMEGQSYEAIASECGCAIGTIKSRVNRARHQLAEKMDWETHRAHH
ncbi:sigma-70 family RNA polymerase sigma factor [Rhizobium sp. BK251]|uniref:sigma-70 family RNA polymerase sigma factor n=1 Tax=Rhizobium sp. BK251 TaxID=2512125 RepID=UPI00104E33C6|nr:sigma-70 family RNA polymerase sigma factor [Rhizobium sp. BK251]TCL66306.1 RNA polymerase sigma-70 factor (ECF subfamily) [Rhizobium sp. BK251]